MHEQSAADEEAAAYDLAAFLVTDGGLSYSEYWSMTKRESRLYEQALVRKFKREADRAEAALAARKRSR